MINTKKTGVNHKAIVNIDSTSKVESIFTMSLLFTPVFLVLIIFLVSYVVSCCFFYLSSSCMPNECWQCFWIVNSSLLLWFIYYICYERLERKWNLSTVVNPGAIGILLSRSDNCLMATLNMFYSYCWVPRVASFEENKKIMSYQ
jgi:hypothetical protein